MEYQVRKGDTLFAISRDNGVALDELMDWNGLTDDRIEVNQRLFLWRAPKEEVSLAGNMFGGKRADGAQEDAPKVASRRPRPRRASSRPMVIIAPVVVEAPAEERERVAINVSGSSVKSAGIMGSLGSEALNGGLDEELSESVYSLSRNEQTEHGVSLGRRSLSGEGGTAETVDIERGSRTDSGGPRVPNVAVSAPNLRRPTAKRCLAGPNAADLNSDDGYLASEGLSIDQIRTAMNGFVRQTMACFPKGTRGNFTFSTEITVGCDGRVSDVWVASDGGLPGAVSQCIEQTLGYASFPAHALPDGMTFQYPIQYRY